MARLNFAEAEERMQAQSNYQGGDFVKTLYLKDKENTFILSLLKDETEVEVHSIHKVKLMSKNGKEYSIDVDCLGRDKCPLCKEALNHTEEKYPMVSKAKDMVYVPIVRLYNYEKEFEPQYNILTRSTKWYRNTYIEAATRFDMEKPLEIMRSGTGVDTTWSLYPATKAYGKAIPEVSAEQLIKDLDIDIDSSISGASNSIVKTWDADMMAIYIETGSWPSSNNSDDGDEEEEEVKPRNNKYGF